MPTFFRLIFVGWTNIIYSSSVDLREHFAEAGVYDVPFKQFQAIFNLKASNASPDGNAKGIVSHVLEMYVTATPGHLKWPYSFYGTNHMI